MTRCTRPTSRNMEAGKAHTRGFESSTEETVLHSPPSIMLIITYVQRVVRKGVYLPKARIAMHSIEKSRIDQAHYSA